MKISSKTAVITIPNGTSCSAVPLGYDPVEEHYPSSEFVVFEGQAIIWRPDSEISAEIVSAEIQGNRAVYYVKNLKGEGAWRSLTSDGDDIRCEYSDECTVISSIAGATSLALYEEARSEVRDEYGNMATIVGDSIFARETRSSTWARDALEELRHFSAAYAAVHPRLALVLSQRPFSAAYAAVHMIHSRLTH